MTHICYESCHAAQHVPIAPGHGVEDSHECPGAYRPPWEPKPGQELGQVVESHGGLKFRLRCGWCGQESSDVPRGYGELWIRQGVLVKWRRVNDQQTYPQCSVKRCDAEGREVHHFAPWNTFGRDADLWPTADLCRQHHMEWHQRMDGYRWTRKASA